MDDFILTTTNFGNSCIFYKNFKFRKYRVGRGGDLSWRCTTRNCSATIRTDNSVTKITDGSCVHANHQPYDERSIQNYTIRNECKRKAVESGNERPARIMWRTLQKNGIEHGSFENIRKAIYRRRRKEKRRQPVSQLDCTSLQTCKEKNLVYTLKDLDITTCKTNLQFSTPILESKEPISQLRSTNLETSKEETLVYTSNGLEITTCKTNLQFLTPMLESREEPISQLDTTNLQTSKEENLVYTLEDIDITTCKTNLQFLIEYGKVIVVEGTFYTSPTHLHQLHMVHVYHEDAYYPILYCLLRSKSPDTYKRMFDFIVSLTEGQFSPTVVLNDMEKAAYDALMATFPSAIIKCCRFHLGQAWYRKIDELGLSADYKNDTEVGKWLKLFFALPFYPADDIKEAALVLMGEASQNPEAHDFCDYILCNYVKEGCPFPPTMWTETTPEAPDTTKAAEAFHRSLRDRFCTKEPSPHLIASVLMELQAETYLKIQANSRRGIKNEVFEEESFINNNKKNKILNFLKLVCTENLPAIL